MHEDTPDFWEWVKNKIKEREQQQPVTVDIIMPPMLPLLTSSKEEHDRSKKIYEDIDHDIKVDIIEDILSK